MFAFIRYPLMRRFLLMSLLILLSGMIVIGSWISIRIRQGVLDQTAMMTAIYVESLLSHHLTEIEPDTPLNDHTRAEIRQLFVNSSFGDQIVAFKLWSPDGVVLYSTSPGLTGLRFDNEDLRQVIASGDPLTHISDLNSAENLLERQQWSELIETYAPLRIAGRGDIVAVAEFYQSPLALDAQIREAQRSSWIVVGVATILMYLALNGMVGQAAGTILNQQQDLEDSISRLEDLLAQNRQLHVRVSRAAARTTALNEQYLRRISSDLHDGPAQDVSLALLRLDSLVETCAPSLEAERRRDFDVIGQALKSAIEEIRSISAGLRLPEIGELSAEETLRRAVRDFQRKVNVEVRLDIQPVASEVPLSMRITLYRIVQEALSNGFRHANGKGQSVSLWQEGESLAVEISDSGTGFEPEAVNGAGRLGLVGMRERVEVLGGSFNLESGPQGTTVRALFPLMQAHTEGQELR